ncbi:dihydroneopterin aldolase [Bacteroidetes bacterium endosymbiont of Geopemphigus sp.]|uniref:dihydroneopterin aldolase n=1 Tax=Bacteroidetes bacterium endosymbiont of Geopemphigus sp. TaxID=2047937 RepID=UPI000CD04E11|nr:dihydroneopterin aldolase [Bacteroidetes bacterium endosymbiont of Geopemphigus sp.]
MDIILLEDIRVYAFHGCLQEERRIGSYYKVDLEVKTDFHKAAQSDELTDTIDYSLLYQIVREQMQIPSYLIENVAHRILKCMFRKYIFIDDLKIKLCKVNPPMEGEIKRVCVLMERNRKDALEK